MSAPNDNYSGRTWSDINRALLQEAAANGYVLPYSVAERQACKGLVAAGKLEPNGCLGYCPPEAVMVLRRRAARERRIRSLLRRSKSPRCARP